MTTEIEAIARTLGARIVGPVPADGGAFGAARLAQVYRERMAELRQRPDSGAPVSPLEVRLSEPTIRILGEIAQRASITENRVSAQEVATRMLEGIARIVGSINDAEVLREVLGTSGQPERHPG